jgi:two-component system, chemotaxis family, CheB/CheR fusion protein
MNAKRSPKKANASPSVPAQPAAGSPPDEPRELFPIVGTGASAGGLEAFTQLLSHLQIDTGMAFVLVQHLDPSQKSLLSEILSRTTQMPVCEVLEGMAVEPNHVYVIPPNTTMTIAQGLLRLSPRQKTSKVIMSIDQFFGSLAADCGSKAIGIILSGGDGDGSKGLEAIKAAGGITFAQSEDSAQVSSMPNTAIATGHVDFILPPAEIAKKLVSMSRHPYVASSLPTVRAAESEDNKDALSTIFGLLRAATKVDFTHYKQTTIKRRIQRRMALYRLEQLDDYVRYLQENAAEVQALYQEILIKVTNFFREAVAFEALKQTVFPALVRDRRPESPIRIWIAGCSTGEEVYSMAICLIEFLADQPYKHPIQIFATDVNELAIGQARLGIYQQSQVVDVSADQLQRFFAKVEGGYQINKSVRELCIFSRHNLVSDPPFSRLDLISCRNVFIYFKISLQRKVLSMFHYGLLPRGFLLLGSSEMTGESTDLFTPVDRKSKIYAKLPSSQPLDLNLMAHGSPVELAYPQPYVSETSSDDSELQKAADRIVLQQFAPAGVVVNAQLEILQFRGHTGAYLEPSPGRASLKLLSMAKEDLRLDLRTTIHQAKEGQSVRKEGISLRETARTGDRLSVRPRQVQIDVIPFKLEAAQDYSFLVLFEDMPQPPEAEIESESEPQTNRTQAVRAQAKNKQSGRAQQELQKLQQELDTTKAYLQSIIEEQESTNQDFRAANEEILSSNEELQSTNEELQTAKEEIQATNEELNTINDELYRRNVETSQVSDDLQNLLNSINIPILMLRSDLKIRRFTASAAHLFNLISSDVGRPFSDIKHRLTITDLEHQILEAIRTLNLFTQEVQDLGGQWYDLRIRPYRTLDNRIDGAVVVLVDIDTLKRSSEALTEARDYAEAIVQTVREPLVVLNADLRVMTANQAFYQTFQVSQSETETCEIFELGNGQWNIPQLRLLLDNLLIQDDQVQDFEVDHVFEQIGRKAMLLNARKMDFLEGRQLILLAIEDISDRPRQEPERTQ